MTAIILGKIEGASVCVIEQIPAIYFALTPDRPDRMDDILGLKVEAWSYDSRACIAMSNLITSSLKPVVSCRLKYKDNDVQFDEELHLYDARLKHEIDEKMQYVKNMLDDTKYYGHRYSMEIVDGELVIFGEWFSIDNPELEEYYQIT